MSIIKIWQLKSVAGQLLDRLKSFAGQKVNLPVLSDSPSVSMIPTPGSDLEVKVTYLDLHIKVKIFAFQFTCI